MKNILAKLALMIVFIQIRVIKLPLIWMPIQSFKVWSEFEEMGEYVLIKNDFKMLMQIYVPAAIIFASWFFFGTVLWALALLGLLMLLNIIVWVVKIIAKKHKAGMRR